MNFLRYIKTVLWSFIGIGRRQDMAQLSERGNPLILVVFAFVLLLVFLITLVQAARRAYRVSRSSFTRTSNV